MVFKDISENISIPKINPRDEFGLNFRRALVSDRLLATFIDFLIIIPMVTLVSSPLVKQIKAQAYFSTGEVQFWGQLFTIVISSIFIIFLYQMLLTFFFSGTLGQQFTHLKVRTMNYKGQMNSEGVSLKQAFLRTALWWIAFLCLGLPFISILGHPFRRAFYELASETVVESEGKYFDYGPMASEANFFNNWINAIGIFIFFSLSFSVVELYKKDFLNHNTFAISEQSIGVCEDFDSTIQGEKRADLLFMKALTSANEVECVAKELSLISWSNDIESQQWSAAIKLTTNQMSAEYEKLCFNSKSTPCLIGKSFLETDPELSSQILRQTGLSTFSARFLLLNAEFELEKWDSAISLLEDLEKEKLFKSELGQVDFKMAWKIREVVLSQSDLNDKKSARKPASDLDVKTYKEYLNRFKDKMEIE